MMSTRDAFFKETASSHCSSSSKVTIVGTGQVGMAAAYALVTQGVCSELALVDVMKDRLEGEKMDLQHGQAFLSKRVTIKASTDYSVTEGSTVCVITAGVRQKQGESRLALVQRNIEILRDIISNLVKHSPNTILLVVSNPVDILTYVTWKLSGLPVGRVVGSGTMLDSSRFRVLLADRLGVSPQSCHGYIMGEHGDSSVAVWDTVSIAGTRLKDVVPGVGTDDDPEHWKGVHDEVIQSADEIIRLKGYTSWAIGVMVATLCNAILKNQQTVYCLSTLVQGSHGIEDEVFLSVPVVVGEQGVTHVFHQNLKEADAEKLRQSSKTLRGVIDGIVL